MTPNNLLICLNALLFSVDRIYQTPKMHIFQIYFTTTKSKNTNYLWITQVKAMTENFCQKIVIGGSEKQPWNQNPKKLEAIRMNREKKMKNPNRMGAKHGLIQYQLIIFRDGYKTASK